MKSTTLCGAAAVLLVVVAGSAPGGVTGGGSANEVSASVPSESGPQASSVACPVKTVFLVGDSLTGPRVDGAGKYAARYFARLGISLRMYWQGGLSVRAALAEKRSTSLGSVAARSADAWIVALGTNDVGAGFGKKIDAVMAAAGTDRPVYWVDTFRPRSWPQGAGGKVNKAIRDATTTHANLHLLAYATTVRSHPGFLTRDRVHLTPAGSRWRARLYASPWKDIDHVRPDSRCQ